jgi:Na+/proline symporter
MSEMFPVGVTGLVIAAIIAASLSSIDSALNSMTAVCMLDFVDRLYLQWTTPDVRKTSEMNRTQVRISRAITIILGIIGITLACNVDRLGTILEIGNKLIASFTGPILGIFLLGMFTRRATRRAVFYAGILGTIVAIYCIFWSSDQLVADLASHFPLILRLFPEGPPLSFQWPPLAGFLTTFGLGFSLSLLEQPDPKASRWTWSSVIQTELKE